MVRRWMVGLAGLAILAAACGSLAPSSPERKHSQGASTHAEQPLDVVCAGRNITVHKAAVNAGPSGVQLRVTNGGDARVYLNYTAPGAGGGDPAPRHPSVWTLAAAPGELRISCSLEAQRGPTAVVEIRDPGHYWRATTLADLGCRGSGLPSWVVGPGHGASAEAAAADLAAALGRVGNRRPAAEMTAVRADVGYPDAPPKRGSSNAMAAHTPPPQSVSAAASPSQILTSCAEEQATWQALCRLPPLVRPGCVREVPHSHSARAIRRLLPRSARS